MINTILYFILFIYKIYHTLVLFYPAVEATKTEESAVPAVAETSTPAPVEDSSVVPAEKSKEVNPESAETTAETKNGVPSTGNFLPSFFIQ